MSFMRRKNKIEFLVTSHHEASKIYIKHRLVDFLYFRALIGQGEKPSDQYDNNPTYLKFRPTEQVEIYLKQGSIKKKVVLPKLIEGNLRKYFNNKLYLENDFDCGSFVASLHYGIASYIYAKRWRFSDVAEKNLQPGDAVVICQRSGRSLVDNHFAIYLSNGVYMSKYGEHKYLTFSTLDDMSIYGTVLRQITPRR